MRTLLQDLRFGLRMLRKNPGFTTVVVLTLALGIGANTTIFSLFNAIVLRPLPVKDAHQIVNLYLMNKKVSRYMVFSYPDFKDVSERNDVFSGVFASTGSSALFNLGGAESDNMETISGLTVSWNYFDVLGVSPVLGRYFLPDEDKVVGSGAVVVLHHDFWLDKFSGDPSVIGKTVFLNHYPFTVIGVTSETFDGVEIEKPDYWALLSMLSVFHPGRRLSEERQNHFLQVKARLKPGISIEQGQAATAVLAEQIWMDIPEISRDMTIALTPGSFLNPRIRSAVIPIAMLVMAAVGLILLIACANVTNLMLARALTRQKEIAVKFSLGAGRWQLIRQLLTESGLLAAASGLVGLLFTYWFSEILLALVQSTSKSYLTFNVTPDIRVFAYTFVITILAGILFGLIPALQSSKVNLIPALKDEDLAFGFALSRSRLRNSLLVAQVALSMILLTSAGLMTRALYQAQTLDPGFEVEHIGFVSMDMQLHEYKGVQAQEFHRNLADRLKMMVGIEAVAQSTLVPLSQGNMVSPIRLEGAEASGLYSEFNINLNYVSPGFFQTLNIPLLRGRDFSNEDISDVPHTAIISEAMAIRIWGDSDPIGKQFLFGVRFGRDEMPWITVIGVARDCRNVSLSSMDSMYLYMPLTPHAYVNAQLLFRSSGDPKAALSTVYDLVRNEDARLVPKGGTMTYNIADFVAESRAGMVLSTISGCLALILALSGIYSGLSFNVRQRTREIGIRMALGATSNHVIHIVLRKGMRMVVAGLVIGLFGAMAMSHLLENFLYGVSSLDALAYLFVSLLMLFSSLFSCYLPARQATKVDPMIALRSE